MDPRELPAVLAAIAGRAQAAAQPAATAMGRAGSDEVKKALRLRHRPAGTFAQPAPGIPPAFVTGRLSRSVISFPGRSAPGHGSALVRPNTVYAVVQEYGAVIWARRRKFMHWVNTGGSWYLKRVTIDEHPYMRTAQKAGIADGSFTRAAAYAFDQVVWPGR